MFSRQGDLQIVQPVDDPWGTLTPDRGCLRTPTAVGIQSSVLREEVAGLYINGSQIQRFEHPVHDLNVTCAATPMEANEINILFATQVDLKVGVRPLNARPAIPIEACAMDDFADARSERFPLS